MYGTTFISILQAQPGEEGVKWASQVDTGCLRQVESPFFPNVNVRPWPRKYFSSSLQAFPFPSCAASPSWWMSDGRRVLQRIPRQELFSSRCDSRSCWAPGKPTGALPLVSAKPGFYLRHTALPHFLSNVWTNRSINLVLMLLGKKWKMNFCQDGIYSQLYLLGSVSHPKRPGPLSNKLYDNRFNFH